MAEENKDTESILSHYKTLIRIRNHHAALRVGDLEVLTTTNDGIYSILRVSEDEALLVLINLGDKPVSEIWITKSQSILPEGRYTPVPILGEMTLPAIEINADGGFFHLLSPLEIAPYQTCIYQLQPQIP